MAKTQDTLIGVSRAQLREAWHEAKVAHQEAVQAVAVTQCELELAKFRFLSADVRPDSDVAASRRETHRQLEAHVETRRAGL